MRYTRLWDMLQVVATHYSEDYPRWHTLDKKCAKYFGIDVSKLELEIVSTLLPADINNFKLLINKL